VATIATSWYRPVATTILLIQDRFHAQIVFANRILESSHQVFTQVGGVIGELDQMSAAFLENLEGEAVFARV
jgi:hypothetical protein